MVVIILLIIPTVWSMKTNPFTNTGTTLAIKHGFQESNNAIPTGISDFKELVLKSKIFHDNSLFCEAVKKRTAYPLLISCPSQWGRSTVLTMVKMFLEIQVDEQGNEISPKESTFNYRLFIKGEILHNDSHVEKLQHPLLIAQKKEFVKIHHGKFPVILVTFKNTVGFDYENIEWKMILAVHEAFVQHEYMIHVLEKKISTSPVNSSIRHDTEKQLNRFRQHLVLGNNLEIGQLDQYTLVTSLAFLSELLEMHFHEKTCVLIDDYDVPILSLFKYEKFPKKDIYRISSLIEAFLTVSTTGNPHCGHGIIMGALHIQFFNWDAYAFREILNPIKDRSLSEFFGFKQPLVEYLFEVHNISHKLENQAHHWYNGYQYDTSKQNFYNPTSIVEFLSHKKIDAYKFTSKYENFVKEMFEDFPNLKNEVLSLISKRTIRITEKSDLMFEWVYKYYIEDDTTKSNNTDIYEEAMLKLFYGVLWAEKYIVKTSEPEIFKLPNNEIAFIMSNWMISFYKQKYQVRDMFLDHTVDALHHLTRSERPCSISFKGSLRILFANINMNFNQSEITTAQEILNCVVLRMQCKSKFEMDVRYNITKPVDLIIYNHEKRQGVIIKLFHNYTTVQELIKNHTEIFKQYSDIQTLLSIQITTCFNKIVDVVLNQSQYSK